MNLEALLDLQNDITEQECNKFFIDDFSLTVRLIVEIYYMEIIKKIE